VFDWAESTQMYLITVIRNIKKAAIVTVSLNKGQQKPMDNRNHVTFSCAILFTLLSPDSFGHVATGIAPVPYNRDDYMTSWRDVNSNCINTRHEVLAIESLIPPTFSKSGCTVVAGLWYDPFTGQEFTSASDVSIDHMVALAEAHKSGGWEWDTNKKARMQMICSAPNH
jgi:hypothetical protein